MAPLRALSLACFLACPVAVAAQDTVVSNSSQPEALLDEPSEDGWTLRLTPYLWIPAQEGDVTIRNAEAVVDLGVGDTFDTITDNFNFGLTLHAELQRDDFTLFTDIMYLSLETEDVQLPMTTGTVRQDMGVLELGVAYRVIDIKRQPDSVGFALEPLVGGRAHYLSVGFDSDGGPSNNGDEFWVDAMVGAGAIIDLHEHFALRLRADIGAGGSDLTWSALAGVDINFTRSLALQFGYRALDTDYSNGSDADRFKYDVLLHGPYIAFTFQF